RREQAFRSLLYRGRVLAEAAKLPGTPIITVGTFDPANSLPACSQLQAFLPPGTRAWGRVNVAIRCLAPAAWSAFVPARLSLQGEFLVLARPLSAGQTIGPDDIARRSGDLTEQPADVLLEPVQAVGFTARYSIAAGRPLSASQLVLPAVVQQGQTVQAVFRGAGFSVSNSGQALNTAAEGQVVQVRLANGQIVRGIAHSGGIVEIGN
ncbi:MAG: flagellar basal body P-ring formation protein FlgA, partial [Zoogloea sp.]|nr:flagellar basal body P-ring formation protein FlgA [Zoogloea sp.]